ncbi:MAG: ABC transporter permease [Candidatus Limnocylindrales bacterium]
MTALGGAARILPVGLGSRRSLLLVQRNAYVYRRTWLVIVSGFFEPLFYLLGIGFGIGGLVGTVPGPNGQPLTYAAFVAPALLAASSMNGAIYDSTINVFFKLKFAKTYDAILSTPLGAGDIALGEVTWAIIRGTLYAIGFFVVMVVLGLVSSPLGILAIPAAMVVGCGFAGVGMAATSFMRTYQDFDLVQLVVLPLFLFSGTFYPLSAYPPVVAAIVQFSPLYRGADLIRGLTLGVVGPVMVVDVVYLLAMGLIGLTIASRRLDRLLLR